MCDQPRWEFAPQYSGLPPKCVIRSIDMFTACGWQKVMTKDYLCPFTKNRAGYNPQSLHKQSKLLKFWASSTISIDSEGAIGAPLNPQCFCLESHMTMTCFAGNEAGNGFPNLLTSANVTFWRGQRYAQAASALHEMKSRFDFSAVSFDQIGCKKFEQQCTPADPVIRRCLQQLFEGLVMLTLRLPFCLQICLNMEQISLEQIVENAAVTLEADKALKRFSAQKALASLSLNILAGVHTSMDARSSLSIMEEALELLTISGDLHFKDWWPYQNFPVHCCVSLSVTS